MPAPATTPTTTAPAPAPTRKSRRVASGRICSPPLDSTSDGSGLAGPLPSGIRTPSRDYARPRSKFLSGSLSPWHGPCVNSRLLFRATLPATPRDRHCSSPPEWESTYRGSGLNKDAAAHFGMDGADVGVRTAESELTRV